MKLIVGLGNPGKTYIDTRHNIGFKIVEKFNNQHNGNFKTKANYEYSELFINNQKVIIIKPQTFMNLSGSALSQVVSYYNIKIEDIIVVYDDLDLDFSKIRIKKNSSSGGHNGVKDIINHLKTKDFLKLKFGINSPYKKQVKDFVLSNFSKDENKEIDYLIQECCNVLNDFSSNTSAIDLMNKYN